MRNDNSDRNSNKEWGSMFRKIRGRVEDVPGNEFWCRVCVFLDMLAAQALQGYIPRVYPEQEVIAGCGINRNIIETYMEFQHDVVRLWRLEQLPDVFSRS